MSAKIRALECNGCGSYGGGVVEGCEHECTPTAYCIAWCDPCREWLEATSEEIKRDWLAEQEESA